MSVDVAAYRRAEGALWDSIGRGPTTEHQVRLAATGTVVRVQEVGEGPPALFLHGGPNTGSTWIPMLEHLEGLRCLLVDRPGTGLSGPYPITASNLPRIGARFVPDLLDGLGLDRAHVVASSFGGHLALRSAAAHPERFDRMVQMAAPALIPGDRMPLFLRALSYRSLRRLMAVLPPNERAAAAILRQIGHSASLDAGRIPPALMTWYVAMQRHTDTMHNDGEMIGSVVPNREAIRLDGALLTKVDVPTLLWWGADDTFGGEDVARLLVELLPDATLTMVPAAGHLPWLDDPVAAAEATSTFLGSEVRQP